MGSPFGASPPSPHSTATPRPSSVVTFAATGADRAKPAAAPGFGGTYLGAPPPRGLSYKQQQLWHGQQKEWARRVRSPRPAHNLLPSPLLSPVLSPLLLSLRTAPRSTLSL